ncbi:MAG: M42 family metallopeptidase [candidate division Zixibacteria bacterium]|nr:M42 family metallopeptidase [candidate division Zixibacteria bacterium]
MDYSVELLKNLTNANGAPGHEDEATKVMASYLKDVVDEIKYDKLGSIIGIKNGPADSPRILIDSHIDEIGFMVKEITKEGFIKFLPMGGWWGHVALGQRMRVMTKKGPVLGVIGSTPPHLLKVEERKKVMDIGDMFIDVGGMEKYDIAKKLGVEVGDSIVPDSEFTVMGNKNVYMAKAFDNRSASAIVIEVLKKFKNIKHKNTLIGSGAVMEEVGLRGAATVAHVTNPDVAIVVDVGIALDIPGYDGRAEKFGGGPSVLIYEGGMIPNTKLRKLFMKTAQEKKIPFNLSYMERGSGDGSRIHLTRSGVPAIYIGPPTRYIHSHNSMMYRKDYDDTIKLIVEVVKKLDKKTVESLTAR